VFSIGIHYDIAIAIFRKQIHFKANAPFVPRPLSWMRSKLSAIFGNHQFHGWVLLELFVFIQWCFFNIKAP